MIQRGDFLFIQKNKKKLFHRIISAGTFSKTVHVAVAISQTHAIEMHLGGLRTRRIKRYKHFRTLRPPVELQGGIYVAIDKAEKKFRWKGYAYKSGLSQGWYHVFGQWLPMSKKDRANCSMLAAYIANEGGETEIQTDEGRYSPTRLQDHLIMAEWSEQPEVKR